MAKLANKIKDQTVLRLVRRFLQSGVLEAGLGHPITEYNQNVIWSEIEGVSPSTSVSFQTYAFRRSIGLFLWLLQVIAKKMRLKNC